MSELIFSDITLNYLCHSVAFIPPVENFRFSIKLNFKTREVYFVNFRFHSRLKFNMISKSFGFLFGLFGTALSGSCNWIYLGSSLPFALQEGECSYGIDGEEESSGEFVCEGSNGYLYSYNNSDCSNDPTSTTSVGSFFDLSCDEGSGCGSVDLRLNEYDNAECNGDPIEDEYIVYVLIDKISCTNIDGIYYTMQALSGTGFQISIYTDSDCSDLYSRNVTIADGQCVVDDDSSTEYVFSGSTTLKSTAGIMTSVILLAFVINS